MPAHVELVWKSPMWCAMKLARGEKIVRSMPRSCIFFSWLSAMLWRSSSSVVARPAAAGARGGRRRVGQARDLAIAPLLELLGGRGVVSVAIDDHGVARSGIGQTPA